MDMLLSTGEQVTIALMAMAIDSLGSKAISMTVRNSASRPIARTAKRESKKLTRRE